MMSFSTNAKLEVLREEVRDDCCALAFLSAIIKGSGQLEITNGKKQINIYTEIKELYPFINVIMNQYYGVDCLLKTAEESLAFKTIRYKICVPPTITDKVLFDTGIMKLDQDKILTIVNGIEPFVVEGECCKRVYIKGAFIACATSNIIIKNYNNAKLKNTSGYHLEFVFNYEEQAQDFMKLLSFFDIHAKTTIRKNSFLVYLKEYQIICDTLALVGANRAVLNLQNEAAIRDLRNNVNRQTNCYNANISKMVNASVKQIEAIATIQNTIGLESLAEPLMELCLIRLANPDEPLDKLRQLYSEPISKSGINHRLKKIEDIAEQLKHNI